MKPRVARATGVVALACVALTAWSARAQPTAGQLLVESLEARGVLAGREARAVEAAADLNPAILAGAARKAGAQADPEGLVRSATPAQLESMKGDLLNRAKLQAIASGAVPVQPGLRQALGPSLSRTGAADLALVSLPGAVDIEAMTALTAGLKIIKPLCPTGLVPALARKDACITGDPWSAELFKAVAPIQVDGKRVCTGAAIGDGVILTAAHCVLEGGGPSGVQRIDPARITLTNLSGAKVKLVAAPDVPVQMQLACLPDCPDMAYDFALLRVAKADADWKPLPVLTRLTTPGEIPITMAGYGVSTMPAGSSKDGLFVGAQRLKLTAVDQPLEWTYGLAQEPGSTFCSGDSGGPIFSGSPRKPGDELALIGVISKFVSFEGTCVAASATAVNLTRSGPRGELCNLLGSGDPFCQP